MAAGDSNDTTPHKRCLDCGYILDGLPENRCPECGRQFDPEDPSTWSTRRRTGRPYLVAALAGAVAMALWPGLYRLAYSRGVQLSAIAAGLGGLLQLSGLALEVCVLRASVRALFKSPVRLRYHRWIVAAFVLSLLLILVFLAAVLVQELRPGGLLHS
ncbi:MAG TPA: hypothetical protein VM487_13650 [Phycisphaerae bacterium]|nr:hypothetical protein [Phycisphaerae bacterium]